MLREVYMIQEIRASKLDTTLLEWKVAAGEAVTKGQAVCIVRLGSMKRTVSSSYDGTVTELKFEPGEDIPGGRAVMLIDAAEEKSGAEAAIPAGEVAEIRMPKIGSPSAKVKSWLKAVGDTVKAGETIASLEAGKLTVDIVSPYGGELIRIGAEENGEIAKDAIVAWIRSDGTAAAMEESGPRLKVLVIGGGPGGYVAAIRAAQLGGEVTLVEREHLGGTCLNIGCIPTKALMHSAEVYRTALGGAKAGVETDGVRLNWQQVQSNRAAVSGTLVGGVKGLLAANGIEYIAGEAAFTGEKKVMIRKADGTQEERVPDRIIIATGSEPAVPPIPGAKDDPAVIDSTGALKLDKLPASMVIIGGGVIGIELACIYAAFGTKITVVEMMDRLMPVMDLELTLTAQKLMEEQGIRFLLETKVLRIEAGSPETEGARVAVCRKDGTEEFLEAEKILVAVGRRSRLGGLEPEKTGLRIERGHLVVNDRMETNVKDIYAAGDCAGRIMLAHTASAMGETAAENALGQNALYNEHVVPSCVYMFPEFAAVGLTEEQIREKGYAYKSGHFPMAANGKSVIMEDTGGIVKILSDERSGKILGVHILGARATDLIAEAAAVMQLHGKVDDLIHLIHAHPTVAEAVHEAALDVEKRAIHFK